MVVFRVAATAVRHEGAIVKRVQVWSNRLPGTAHKFAKDSTMEKVAYRIHHQAVVDCPKCEEMHVSDLGEDNNGDGIKIMCPCGYEFKLSDSEHGKE